MTDLDPHRFYVYVIFRPEDGSPCYVGMGSRNRWSAHEKRCHNPRLRRVIERSKGNVIKVKIREGLLQSEAHAVECALIVALGRSNKGPLVNMTDGGEGTVGYKRTKDQIEAMRQRMLGRPWSDEARENARNGQLGRKHSEKTRARISASNVGKTMSPEAVEKMVAAKKGKPLAPEHREKVSEVLRRPKSEEHKAKLRAMCIERNKKGLSEESRAKISAANKGRPSPMKGVPLDPAVVEKMRESRKGQPSSFKGKKHTEEARAKLSEKAKARTDLVRDDKGRYKPA